jgi:endonuclease G, mitochondrial
LVLWESLKLMQCLRSRLKPLLSLFLIALLCGACALPPVFFGKDNVQMLLGNPSHGVGLESSRYKQFLRPQYAMLYDRTTNTAAWVSWQLNRGWIGTLNRPPFTPDSELPAQWYEVTPHEYTDSGFDRGHLVPAADRNHTQEDEAAVFKMTNIVPQAPDNNRGPWEGLEHYCRVLAKFGNELYIIAGPVGRGGVGSLGSATAIARGKVTVPAALWKIVVVKDRPGQGIKGINERTRVIAVLMPNKQGIKEENWKQFRTTVRAIEQQTGFDFLSNLSPKLQDALETHVDGR